jgi:hypothetical protein
MTTTGTRKIIRENDGNVSRRVFTGGSSAPLTQQNCNRLSIL